MPEEKKLRGPMKSTLIRCIATTVSRIHNLENSDTGDPSSAYDELRDLQKILPRGSGIDSGVDIKQPADGLDEFSQPNRLVLTFGYHHMDENGMYCGWTHWRLVVTPTFDGFDLEFELVSNDADFERTDEESGEVYDDKEFAISRTEEMLGDLFHHAFNEEINRYWDDEEKRAVFRVARFDKCVWPDEITISNNEGV